MVGSVGQPEEGCAAARPGPRLSCPKGQAGKGMGREGRGGAWAPRHSGPERRGQRRRGREGQGEAVTEDHGDEERDTQRERERRPGCQDVGVDPGRDEASWTWAADAWPVPKASRPSPVSPHARHLGEADEAELLGQEGVVVQAHGGPDGLVDGAVAEVHLRRGELQVRGGDYGVDCELHRLDLKCRGQAHFRSHAAAPRTRPKLRRASGAVARGAALPGRASPLKNPLSRCPRTHDVEAAVTERCRGGGVGCTRAVRRGRARTCTAGCECAGRPSGRAVGACLCVARGARPGQRPELLP